MEHVTMKTAKIMMLMLGTIMLGACTAESQIIPKKVMVAELQHNWKLTHIDNIQLAVIIDSTLKIESDNKSSGNLSCNHFIGEAEFSNNQLRIGNMANTRKMCSEIKNNVEADVTSVLSNWANVMIDGETLIISNKKHSLTYQLADIAS
jgi:heat shock protein HslJ